MVTLLVQLWANEGEEHLLVDYEDRVLELLPAHGARLLQRVRASEVASGPFEAQILEFPSEAALDAYMVDPARVARTEMRDRAVARTEVFRVDVVSAS